jgi:hypothetical protein
MPKRPPQTIESLLREAAKLTKQAAELAGKDDLDGAMALEQEADRLRRRARSRAKRTSRGQASPRSQSAREGAVAALNELGVPASPREITDYAAARFGRTLDYRAFASIRRDERRAFDSPRTQRAVYIVPALEGRWLLPARGRFTLSEWPVEQRLIGPHSLRADHLNATINIATQVDWLATQDKKRAKALYALLTHYAITVPGAPTKGKADTEGVRAAARAELEVLREEDDRWRRQQAERVKALAPDQRLWGAQPPHLVAEEAEG